MRIALRRKYVVGVQGKRMKSSHSRSGVARTKIRDKNTPPPAHRTMAVDWRGRTSWQ
jgi:hypothetical protein